MIGENMKVNSFKTEQLPEFDAWFSEKWLVSGGLITPATAAKILNKTAGRITQMMTEGKIKSYKYKNIPFVCFPDVMRIAKQQQFEIVMEQIKEMQKDKRVPEHVKEQYLEEIMPTLELLKNSVETD